VHNFLRVHFSGCFIPQLTVSSTPLAVIEWQLYD
jgi:hypothetical protein